MFDIHIIIILSNGGQKDSSLTFISAQYGVQQIKRNIQKHCIINSEKEYRVQVNAQGNSTWINLSKWFQKNGNIQQI